MAYEIVYKNKNFDEKRYLTKKDLESLIECNLLWFLKKERHNTLYDYPCMGGSEERLCWSSVTGPFESVSKNQKKDYYENNSKILELLIPTTKMPIKFEEYSLVEYGTYADSDNLSHLNFVAKDKINFKKMVDIGQRVLNNFSKRDSMKKISNSHHDFHYAGQIGDCLAEFEFTETDFYPLVKITLFGKGEEPQQIFQELKIRELGEQFQDSHHAVIGMEDSIQRGLAYNFSLNGKNISETIKSENVLI